MPYKNDPRRTVTLNLPPAAYAALADDARAAGYATPGTYALALVRARGAAPAPVRDQRAAEQIQRLTGSNEWLRQQLVAAHAQLAAAGVPVQLATEADGGPLRSAPAQARAVATAVDHALVHERARVARSAAPAQDPPA